MSMGNITNYFKEVTQEVQKVSWPSKEQTIEKTLLVLTVTVVVGLYVGTLDFVFSKIITAIL